uniref:Neurofascin n=1 Tax=Labrus bergylta TaxID=56723 RepID=A0A3Q3FAH5_9LABR
MFIFFWPWCSCALCYLCSNFTFSKLMYSISLPAVRQPPTIIKQSMKDHIVDPKDTMVIECEAKGNPHPIFSWRRNGKYFNVARDPQASVRRRSGTLDIYAWNNPEQYEAEYQCIASNEYGSAYSNKIRLRLYRAPVWPREILEPVVVSVGLPLVLSCDPPPGPPFNWPIQTAFPTMQPVRPDRRVSMGVNGDLYFSNVLFNDSDSDYCCNARFPYKNVIQQKMPVGSNPTSALCCIPSLHCLLPTFPVPLQLSYVIKGKRITFSSMC